MYRCFGSYNKHGLALGGEGLKSKIELTKKQKFLAAAGTGLLILVILWPASEKTPAGMSEDKSGARQRKYRTDGGGG